MKIYDVVIVGAGPVGLATAIGLYTRGITNILVIDRARAFQRVGQRIDLLPNGLKAVKYIDLNAYEAVLQSAIVGKSKPDGNAKKPKWQTRNSKGDNISKSNVSLNFDDWYELYGEGRVSSDWYELQKALRNQLPADLVLTNRRCHDISFESEYVKIDCLCNAKIEANPYAHWQEKEPEFNNNETESISKSLFAKLVVAADGINSTIRQILYRDSPYADFAKPEYAGYAAISCRGIELPEAIATAIKDKYLKDNPVVSIATDDRTSRMSGFLLFCRDSKYGYLVHFLLPLAEIKDRSEETLIDLILKELAKTNLPDILQELVSKSAADSMIKRLYYIQRATISDSITFPPTADLVSKNNSEAIEPLWHQDRVVLVGDAAHGMPPLMAQGANQGLEDAAVISNAIANLADNNNLDNTDAIAEAFLKYDKLRRPIVRLVQEVTVKSYLNLSPQELQDYSKQVYGRNLEEIIVALV